MPLGSLLGFAGAYCLKLHFYLKREAVGSSYSVINPEDHNLEIVSISFAFHLSPTHSCITKGGRGEPIILGTLKCPQVLNIN